MNSKLLKSGHIKLYKRENSKYWQMKVKMPKLKAIRSSTGSKILKDAEKIALKYYSSISSKTNIKLKRTKNIFKKIHLVEKVEDVKKLPLNQNDEIAYVTQTTLSVDDTKDIIKEIKLHFSNVIEPKKNDICYATTNRQEAVKKIANQCDYFLVIGASNSSNSLRLVEVAKNYGSKKAILVEDVDSLNLNIFQESENIGITASASSPEVLVKKLLDNLKRNFEIHINEGSYQKEDVFFKVPQKLNV